MSKRNESKKAIRGLEIREMELDDLPPVFALGETLFTAEKWPTLYRTWDEYELVGFFESDGEFCFVAELDEKVIGFVMGTLIEKRHSAWVYGYVAWLGIHSDYQGAGVGKKLLNHLTDVYIEHGARMMLIDTDPENKEAVRFFERNGFENQVPHVYLSKNLTDHPEYLKRKRRLQRKRHKGPNKF